ncbi:recombinase A [Deferrisoma sp.]
MSLAALRSIPVVPASRLGRSASPAEWSLEGLAGRVVEVSGGAHPAPLTAAVLLVRDAQARGEPVAWITSEESAFYPPDAAEAGVDLDALAVVRAPGLREALRAADHLLRSGAFGLVVLDLGDRRDLTLAAQTRLGGLAQEHGAALVCLTRKPDGAPSLGSLVSLRVGAGRRRLGPGRFACRVEALKDKRRGPGWGKEVPCRAPDGLR